MFIDLHMLNHVCIPDITSLEDGCMILLMLDSFRVSTFFLTHAACYPQHALTGCLARFRHTTRECRVGWFFSESICLVSKGKESMLLALLAPHQLSSLTQINIVCLTCA